MSCISSVSYIKPQRRSILMRYGKVVYRPFPTSNHNRAVDAATAVGLYIVRFLHQTTTYNI